MRRSVLPIAAMLTSSKAAAAGGQSPENGSVAGHVTLTTRIKGSALPSTAYPTRAVGSSDTHAIPGTDATFELPNVPPGEYTVVGWHERVGERRARVRVEGGRAATVDLSLPVQDPQ
jgi:hypothetical protein